MCDTSLATASVEALAGELDEASEPHKRLPLLLALADGVSTIDARRAMDLAQEADALAANLENMSAQGEALYLQGRCADLLLDQTTALDAYAKALQAFEAAQDDRAVARTLRAISFIHDTLGNFPRALDYQFQALELDERTGNQGSRAATLRTIGLVYSRSADSSPVSISTARASRCARSRAMRSSAARRSTTSVSTSRTWASSTRRTRR